jgi:hypothetical protein
MRRRGILGIVLAAGGVVLVGIALLSRECSLDLPGPPPWSASMTCSGPSPLGLVAFGFPGLLLVVIGVQFVFGDRKTGRLERAAIR